MNQKFQLGQIVVTRPASDNKFTGDCEIPCEIVGVYDDKTRYWVAYAAGNEEEIGDGDLRAAEQWQIDSFRQMRAA